MQTRVSLNRVDALHNQGLSVSYSAGFATNPLSAEILWVCLCFINSKNVSIPKNTYRRKAFNNYVLTSLSTFAHLSNEKNRSSSLSIGILIKDVPD